MTPTLHWRTSTFSPIGTTMLLVLLLSTPSLASTITVAPDGTGDYTTLQDAIDAASNGDVILVAPGTYTGEGESVIDFDGKSITLRSEQGPAQTVIDAQDARRGIAVVNISDEMQVVTIDGFTIKQGVPVPHDYNESGQARHWESFDGGGMLCVSTENAGHELANSERIDCTVIDCIFEANNARRGGGVYSMAGDVSLNDCTFNDNSADENGGGVYEKSTSSSVTTCTFNENHAVRGAGLQCAGETTLNGCFFNDNEASASGGGVQDEGAASTLANCIFNGNSTEGDGGGLHTSTSSSVTGCIFEHNEAGSCGGGVYLLKEAAIFIGCTFRSNHANGGMNADPGDNASHGGGGGLRNFQGHPHLANCVFEDNMAPKGVGGGMSSKGAATDAEAVGTLTHCRFSSNQASTYGGGMYNGPFSTTTLTRCTLSENSAGTLGGGIYNDINDDADRSDDNVENDGGSILECAWICGNFPNHIEGPWTDLDGNTFCSDCSECQRDCPADLNDDGFVDGADLASLLAEWGALGKCVDEDLNGDWFTNGADLAIMLNSWGPCP